MSLDSWKINEFLLLLSVNIFAEKFHHRCLKYASGLNLKYVSKIRLYIVTSEIDALVLLDRYIVDQLLNHILVYNQKVERFFNLPRVATCLGGWNEMDAVAKVLHAW